jgi:hypothetical protein
MAGQGSARVNLKEIDLSQVRNPQQSPQGVPAAVVGPAKKGPAFVPKTFANMQQFSEVFGDMIERSKESNSNLFGPLALDQWLNNANSGTFVRTLGVGDGSKNATNAGFVVGDQPILEGTNKVGDNPHAQEDTGSTLGRTHILGCFMKDESNSKLLQDAGVQVSQSSGQLDITFSNLPTNADTLSLIGRSAAGADKTFTITFDGTVDTVVHGNGTIAIGMSDFVGTAAENSTALALRLERGLKGLDAVGGNAGLGAALDPATYFNATAADSKVTIVQRGSGLLSNKTLTSNITHAANDTVVISNGTQSIKNGLASQTVAGTTSGAGLASTVITVGGTPTNDSAITITDMLGNTLPIRIETGNALAPARDAGGAGTVKVGVEALNAAQTASKIEDAITFGIGVGEGAFQDSGAANTVTVVDNGDGTITLSSVLKGSVDLFAIAGNAENNITEVQTDGSNGSLSTITLTLTGQPAVNNEFTLNSVEETTNAATDLPFKFVAEDVADPGSLNGTDGGGKIQIEIGATVDLTLARIQSAIEASNVGDKYTVIVDTVADSVLIRRTQTQGFVQDRNFVFQLNNNVTVVGDLPKQGRFGPLEIDFAGGEGFNSSPVIRGILMSPQGVVPSLDVESGTANFDDAGTRTDLSNIRDIDVSNKNFAAAGNVKTSLAGYQIGSVDLSSGGDQAFKLILNGLSNKLEPVIINCSFDPDSKNYFAKVLNTDPTKMNERGHYLYAHWDIYPKTAKPSNLGVVNNTGAPLSGTAPEDSLVGFLLKTSSRDSGTSSENFEGFDQRFQTAKTPWFVSQYFSGGSNTSRQLNNVGLVLSTGGAKKLFRLHALDDGVIGNDQFRVLISGIRSGNKGKYGSFNLSLELFSGNPVEGDIVVSWQNLSLDPESPNFIARVIGDQHMYYNFDADSNRQRLVLDGIYPVRNDYVRVELAQDLLDGDVNVEALPVGFRGPRRLKTNVASLFTELGDNGSGTNKVLSTNTFDSVQVAPLPFVKSLSRELIPSTTYEIDDSLAWGIKFAKRELGDQKFNENSELTFNESLKSWALYFPDGVCDEDSGTADAFQNNFFSLEKIAVKEVSGEIDWNSAKYSRDGSLPNGYQRFVDASTDLTTLNSRYLKLRSLFQGGFDGLNIFDEEKALQTNTATHREAQDERNDGSTTGSTILGYRKALDVLTDKSAVEFQLLAVPGIREPQVTDYAVKACEDRFDAMFLMDIEEVERSGEVKLSSSVQAHVRKTVARFEARNLDSSFAAAYFPDVLIRKPSTGGLLAVPPSVVMLGAMSRNDLLADPWFAPAGLNRGRLAALNSNLQMNRDLLDELYDADINPIYEPAGRPGEVYAFGQKTLLRDQSALDRINVRRLLIDIRRKVKGVAESLLFEPNRASTLQRFSALVEPIMQNVQQRQGVERYKVQIDTATTTQNDIENNTIRGKVYLQPTKSVEFISLDFVVTNSINQ